MRFYRTLPFAQVNRLALTLALGIVLTGAAMGAIGLQASRVFAVACTVPSAAYPTIQAAVDDANCDEIDVAAGAFTESVNIQRNLTLRGAGDELTILDGQNSQRPLTVGLSDSAVIDTVFTIDVRVHIENLAVRNGNATTASPSTPPSNSGRIGGGILVRNKTAVYLTNVRVYDNIARASGTGSGFGGGIGVYGGSELHAQSVRVYGNTASTSPISGFGGGIASLGSSLYMTDTYVYENVAKNNSGGQGQGGGIYVENFAQDTLLNPSYAYAHIWNSEIYSNTAAAKGGAGYGGGLYAGETGDTHVWLYDNLWRGNAARGENAGSGDGYGGAVAVDVQTAGAAYLDVYGDEFRQNSANAYVGLTSTDKAHGGAIYLDANATGLLTATLASPYFASNYAESGSGSTSEQGGALWSRFVKVAWSGGKATSNKADRNNPSGQGGAVRINGAPLSIYEAELYDNVAAEGGAIYARNDDINKSGYLRLRNVMAADNSATTGAQIYFANANFGDQSWLRHATLADEGTNPSQAVYVDNSKLEVRNSIVANHATGIQSSNPQTSEDYNLFFNNSTNTNGAIGIGGNSTTGDPQFVSPITRDYHIGPSSAARNLGTDLGIATDIDGESRDVTPDAGADEYTAATPTPTNSPTVTDTPLNTETPTPTFTPTTVQTTKTVTVEVVNDQFNPASITINVGDTVVWQRIEGFHNVREDNDTFRLGENQAGDPGSTWESVSYTFGEVGTFGYYCEVHGAAGGIGMAGEVIVQEQVTPTPTATTVTATPIPTGTESPTATPTATPQTVVVEVNNNFFAPASVTINVGDTVEWKRLAGFHNIRSDDGFFRLGDANGEVSNTWDTVSFTFTEPGIFPYYCEAHGQPGGVGMAGEVIVVAPTPTPTSMPTATGTVTPMENVVLNEIYYVGDANSDWIEIKNGGTGAVSIGDWWLTAGFEYAQIRNLPILSGDTDLGPGEIVVVRAWRDLSNTVSDLGLYKDNNGGQPDFTDQAYLADFIQYGNEAAGAYSGVALNKGIWREVPPGGGSFDFAPAADAGESTQYDGTDSGGGYLTFGSDFYNGSPSLGQENRVVTATPSTTPPTSTPSPSTTPEPGAPEDVVISEVYYTSDANGDWIELRNSGNGQVDVSGWQFCATFSYKALAEMTILDPATGQARAASAADLILDPGEYLVLRSWMDLSNASDMALYTAPDFASPSALVDFVQWGTPNDVGRADVAAAKGIWPETSTGQYDFAPPAAAGESLALVSSNTGTAAADFRNGPPTQGRSNTSSGSTKVEVFLPLIKR